MANSKQQIDPELWAMALERANEVVPYAKNEGIREWLLWPSTEKRVQREADRSRKVRDKAWEEYTYLEQRHKDANDVIDRFLMACRMASPERKKAMKEFVEKGISTTDAALVGGGAGIGAGMADWL